MTNKLDMSERYPDNIPSILALQDLLREHRKQNNDLLDTVHRMKFCYADAGNIVASLRNVDRSLLAALQILQGRR
jgi:hypothetical protein